MLDRMRIAAAMAVLLIASCSSDAMAKVIEQGGPSEKIAFAFELIRHGARAPVENLFLEEFKVDQGILTAEGKRERYLRGRSTRQRYTKEYDLLSSDLVHGEIFMQSTNVKRVIESGFSELMGIYPPGESGVSKLSSNERRMLHSRAAPPMKVRNSRRIDQELGDSALPNDFAAIPVVSYLEPNIKDYGSENGCPYIFDLDQQRQDDPNVWRQHMWMKDEIKRPLQIAFQLTDEQIESANYHMVNQYADTVRAMRFEGVSYEDTFTFKQWLTALQVQKIYLANLFTEDTRALMLSRMMQEPLRMMDLKVEELYAELHGNTAIKKSPLKYMILSAHDTQVDNMVIWLNPTNYILNYINYASSVVFELMYDETCLANATSKVDFNACFWVDIYHDQIALSFEDSCSGGKDGSGTGCSLKDFRAMMMAKWYSDPVFGSDLDAACYRKYTPEEFYSNP